VPFKFTHRLQKNKEKRDGENENIMEKRNGSLSRQRKLFIGS